MNQEVNEIMTKRFGKDSLIALATCQDSIPHVRTVDAYYEDGSFYIITYYLSNKMKQIAINQNVAVSGEWFTGHGKAMNLGYFKLETNKEIATKLTKAFASWIDNGHNDFEDKNTIILQVQLTDGVVFAEGKKYTFN